MTHPSFPSPRPRTRIIPASELPTGQRIIAQPPSEEPRSKREPNSGSFEKGVSGNPKGRPKGAKGSKAIMRQVLLEKVDVRVKGERRKKMTALEALVMQERKLAFDGEWRARNTMFALARWALGDAPERGGEETDLPAVGVDGELTEAGKAILDWFSDEVREQDKAKASADGNEGDAR